MATSAILSITEAPVLNQLRNDGSSEAGLAQAILYAAMGTALGLLVGISAASGTWGTNTLAMANNSAQLGATSAASMLTGSNFAGFSSFASQQTAQASSMQDRAPQIPAHSAPTATEPAAPAPVRAAHSATLPQNLAAPAHHAAFKALIVHAVASEKASATAVSVASDVEAPAVTAAAPMVDASAAAAVEEAPKPAMTMIEGDLTMADFDASTGTVETREGRNFSVSQGVTLAGSEGNTLAWQDYAGHVHYRCTQAGNCTLSGSGISSGARLI